LKERRRRRGKSRVKNIGDWNENNNDDVS